MLPLACRNRLGAECPVEGGWPHHQVGSQPWQVLSSGHEDILLLFWLGGSVFWVGLLLTRLLCTLGNKLYLLGLCFPLGQMGTRMATPGEGMEGSLTAF